MDKSRFLLAIIAAFSILINVLFAGVALRVWLRSADGSTPTAVLSTLPDELRDELRSAVFQADSRIAAAQTELRQSRSNLQSLLSADEPNPQALQSALVDVREDTLRLQTELHAVIFQFYATAEQQ